MVHRRFNRSKWVQASYRFSMAPGADRECLKDPNHRIEWDFVEDVVFQTVKEHMCPICLGKTQAAVMTKCGHVFCLPCLLQYIAGAQEGRRWRKCPLCNDIVYVADTRSARSETARKHEVGQTVRLCKFYSPEASAQVAMLDCPEEMDRAQQDLRCARISILDDNEPIVQREERELMAAIKECDPAIDRYTMPFLKKALGMVQAKRAKWAELYGTLESSETRDDVSVPPPAKDSTSYFYQSVDGQRVYLDGLNWRCLQQQFGSDFEAMPQVLEGKIIDITVMNTAQERRVPRYLSHLPSGSELVFVELDLHHILSVETREAFRREIFKREEHRRQNAARRKKEDALQRRREEQARQDRFLRNAGFAFEDEAFPILAPEMIEQAPDASTLQNSTAFPELAKAPSTGPVRPHATPPKPKAKKLGGWNNIAKGGFAATDDNDFWQALPRNKGQKRARAPRKMWNKPQQQQRAPQKQPVKSKANFPSLGSSVAYDEPIRRQGGKRKGKKGGKRGKGRKGALLFHFG